MATYRRSSRPYTGGKVAPAWMHSRSFFTPLGADWFGRSKPGVRTPFAPEGATCVTLPLHIMVAKYIAPATKLVWGFLELCARGKGWCNPGIGTLAHWAGIAPTAVERAIDRLERYGYVRRVKTPRDRDELRKFMQAYHSHKQLPESAFQKEWERLFPKKELPDQSKRLTANVYVLRWGRYWDLAWQFQAASQGDSVDASVVAEIAEKLVHGCPEHRRKKTGKKWTKKSGSEKGEEGRASEEREATPSAQHITSAAAAESGGRKGTAGEGLTAAPAEVQGSGRKALPEPADVPGTLTMPDAQAEYEFFQLRMQAELGLGYKRKSVSLDERAAVEALAQLIAGRKEHPVMLRAVISWYVYVKARPLRARYSISEGDDLRWYGPGTIPSERIKELRINLIEACAGRTAEAFFAALRSIEDTAIPDEAGQLPRSPEQRDRATKKLSEALGRSGMILVSGHAHDRLSAYLDARDSNQKGA